MFLNAHQCIVNQGWLHIRGSNNGRRLGGRTPLRNELPFFPEFPSGLSTNACSKRSTHYLYITLPDIHYTNYFYRWSLMLAVNTVKSQWGAQQRANVDGYALFFLQACSVMHCGGTVKCREKRGEATKVLKVFYY